MSKKILAIALFAVMVLSLVPFANADPVAGNPEGSVLGAGLYNQNQTTTSSTVTGDVTLKKQSNSVYNLTVEKKFSELTKVSGGWYTDDVVKYNVYVALNGFMYTGNTNDGTNSAPFYDALGTPKVNDSTLGWDVATGDKLFTDGSVIEYEDAADTGLGIPDTGAYTLVKLATFEAKKGGNTATYKFTYLYGGETRTVTVNVTFKDQDGASKPEQPMWLKFENAGDEGLYNVYTVNGVIYIDYANDLAYTPGVAATQPIMPLDVKFFADAAGTVKLPASGQRAEVKADGTSDGARGTSEFFVDPIVGNMAVTPGLAATQVTTGALGVRQFNEVKSTDTDILGYDLNSRFTGTLRTYVNFPKSANGGAANGTTNQTVSIKIETNDYLYAAEVKVVWRPVPRNQISNVVISQRNITLKVGETVKLEVLPTMQTTYSTLKLQDSAAVPIVYVDGMSITGSRIGTTALNVYFGGQAIDAITVTVVAADSTTTPAAGNQWRVLARTLNVRTGPGTGYAKVGTLSMNSVVTGTDTGLGWIELSNGTYVSKQHVTPVNAASAVGNYVTTASSLNVRSGPGSSYGKIGSLPRGSVVNVLAIQGSWAQTNAGWVSTLYLNAI